MIDAHVRSKIQEAREQFQKRLPVDTRHVRREILESWERSRSYGLKFDSADKTIISAEALKKRIDERRTFYDIAIPFMENLYDFTTGSGFLSILSDENGYVLKTMGDEEICYQAKKNRLVEGCNRDERSLGTNAIGTAIAIGRPIQVFAEEHFYRLHHKWVCSGAPIFDPEGRTIGVFCLTGLIEMVSFHTLGMAAAAAAAISQQIKMQQAYDAIERIQKRTQVIVETVPSGILLLNRELEIIQINTRSSLLLMLPPEEIIGKNLGEVINKEHINITNIKEEIDEQDITIERAGQSLHFTFTLNASSTDEYVITFVKTEILHKKINRIIGSDAHFHFEDIVGRMPIMRNAISLAQVAAKNISTVLLTGESGTGKELFAQSIHNAGPRRDGPFVAINCGALPKSLIESELFGYEKGSFTGGRRDGYVGKFELANGGTIFLDEIGDMPFDVQSILLRVLQNREVSRLGCSRPVKIDVRVIAATNKDLLSAIENNEFRGDLYYRLNVFRIHIPPLRERIADIRLLADYFLRKYAELPPYPVQGFSEECYRALEGHPWRGNTRELENVVERAVYLCRGGIIGPEHLNLQTGRNLYSQMAYIETPSLKTMPHSVPEAPNIIAFDAEADNAEELILRALHATNGNMKQAAALLGMSRRTLYRKLNQLHLDPDLLRRSVRNTP